MNISRPRVAFCILALSIAADTHADNLAPNPGFEIADGDVCAFWAKRTPNDAARKLEWTSENPRSGRRCMKITNLKKTKSRWRTGHIRDLVLAPGTPAKLSAWIKTRGKDCKAYLTLYSMKADGRIAAQHASTRVTGDSEWREAILETTIPDAAAYTMIYLELEGTGTAWYDDVVLDATRGERKVDLTMKPTVYKADDLEILDGLQVAGWRRKRFLQLAKGAKTGRAQRFFFGESAQYDIGLACVDEFRGNSSVGVLINDREAGVIKLDTPKGSSKRSYADTQKALSGVNVQRYSKITLKIAGDRGERCRIEKLILTPVGRFEGEFAELKKSDTLRIFESIQEQRKASAMLRAFVSRGVRTVTDKRKAELASLKTPEEWRARQRTTRARLHEFNGEFPRKTPLNAKIVGKLDREKYVIEKLIFESQPKYYCTANFYVPKDRELPAPGVIFTCGHSRDGKAERLYHECCLGLVLKGYVVLALDPMGQGERSEYFDPETKKPLVGLTVSQHHYVGRPAFLVDWSLSGLRTWDCIRAVDYLVSRPEVDRDKLAAVGNSGGGQMALLITAADERIKVCAAAHPGGSMENTYLLGHSMIDREVLSLIPPRPCRIIVGQDSGEEGGHRGKLVDMQRFYEGLGAGKHRGEMAIVHGVHNMKRPKREAAYEWLNKWFGKEAEGKAEPPLEPEEVETLWCTETGCTLISLGGESGQTLNARRAERMYKRESDLARLRQRVAKRVGFTMPRTHDAPSSRSVGRFASEGFTARKLAFESEEGIEVPALLLTPKDPKPGRPVIIHASDRGKPTKLGISSIPLAFVREGYTVLSIDVRGTGETDPSPPAVLSQHTGYTPTQWRRDSLAIQSPGFGRTMLGMRALDVVRAIDFAKSRNDLKGKGIVLVGEGLGGLWMLLAAAYDSRPDAVVCVGTLPSYKLLLSSQYYNVWGYFWVPGALRDFDIPDLARLAAPRPQLWVDPVDALAHRLDEAKAHSLIGEHKGVHVVRTTGGTHEDIVNAVRSLLE